MSEFKEIKLLGKIKFILKGFKRDIFFIMVLLLIGMLFEMASIGIIIPSLGFLLSSNIQSEFPSLIIFFKRFGLNTQKEIVLFALGTLVFIFLIKTIFMVYLSWKQSNFSANLSSKTSNKLYSVYLNQPYGFHLLRNSAELTRNIIGEVHEFSEMLKAVFVLTIELMAMLGITLILIFHEPLGTFLIFLVLGFSTFILQRITKKKLVNWGQQRQFHDGQMKQKLAHGLLGIKYIKIRGLENFFLNEFNYHNFKKIDVVSKQYALTFFPRLYLEFIAVVGLVGFMVFEIYLNVSLNTLLPTIAIFIAGAFRMIPSANRIIGSMQYIRYSKPVIDIIYNEILFIESESQNKIIAKEFVLNNNVQKFEHTLTLKNVDYIYSGTKNKVLFEINLTLHKGETVGFVGTSGSGKSTLIDIILGLLTPTNGAVEIDGKPIIQNIQSWQKLIGYVPQTIFLTDDTIRNNIAFGVSSEDINDEAVLEALKSAQLESFIKTLPDGLDTFVGEQGVRLSGGQRQRLGLARALYHHPEVILLDEATSALDSQTEKFVMETVMELRKKKTIVIVAHRLSTLQNCDKIYRLEKGKIIKEGKPAEVLL